MTCDCAKRIGVEIRSYGQFEEIQNFFQEQTRRGVFLDIPVTVPYYVGKGTQKLKWYADKWYKCNVCGTLWEFCYPDFPASGFVRKFADGQYVPE